MKRRSVLVGTSILLVAPAAVLAQQTGRVWRIGWVSPGVRPAVPGPIVLAFKHRLRENALVEGENVVVDWQFMGGREAEYAAVLEDLERRVDVIFASGPPAALAAKKVVTKVPVIFAAVGDPVGIGLVQSLAKPGGNFTGVAFDVSPDIAVKRLALLREVHPSLARLAALWSSSDPVGIGMLAAL